MTIQVSEGDVISFQLVAGGIIKNAFTNVKVIAGSMAYDGAKLIDPDLASKHANMYPFFKDAVNGVNSPNAYSYVIVMLANSTIMAVGIPWIIEDTLNVTGNRTATITITSFQEKFRNPIIDLLGNLGATYTLNVTE